MILDDRVELTGRKPGPPDRHGNPTSVEESLGMVPAHVGAATGTSPFESGWGRTVIIDELRAIIPPDPRLDDYTELVVTWRENPYRAETRLPVHRHGRPHHVTLKLERVT